jgi:hypothetical protein
VNEAEIDLVDQSRGLKRVIATFLSHVIAGNAAQFRVKGGGSLYEGVVAFATRIRESCYIFRLLAH